MKIDKETMKRLLVVFVAALFMIGMFSYFEKEDTRNKAQGAQGAGGVEPVPENFSAAEGYATGKLQSYSSVLYITPWNESYRPLIEELKSEGQVGYINIADKVCIATLVPKANLSRIREKLENIDAAVFADATVIFPDPVNFTLFNGSTKLMNINPITARLDPSTPIGEVLTAHVTADISQRDMKNAAAVLKPDIVSVVQEVELSCTSSYYFQGNISWADRMINVTAYTGLLNVSEDKISYRADNSVILPKKLNSTEMADLRNKNTSFMNLILGDTIYVDTTSKAEVESALSYLGTNFTYPDSEINATFESEESRIPVLASELGRTVGNLVIKRNCGFNMSKLSINGTNYYVEINSRSASRYITLENATGGMRNASIDVYTIGRSASKLVLLDVQ